MPVTQRECVREGEESDEDEDERVEGVHDGGSRVWEGRGDEGK